MLRLNRKNTEGTCMLCLCVGCDGMVFHIDFHVHTVYSHDSFNHLNVFMDAQKKDYYVAITDHNNFRGVKIARMLGLRFIPGIEVTTDRGDLIGLYLEENMHRYYKGMDYYEMIDRVKEDGGLTVIPHPFDWMRRKAVRNRELAELCDIIEGYNSRSLFESANITALKFAINNNKPFTVGSDAHFPIELWNSYIDIEDEEVFDNPKSLLKELNKSKQKYYVQQTFLFAPTITWMFKHVYKILAPVRYRYNSW